MLSHDLFHMSDRAREDGQFYFCDRGNSNRSNQVFSPRQEFFVLAATVERKGEGIMATKITTALVAALAIGASGFTVAIPIFIAGQSKDGFANLLFPLARHLETHNI